MNLPWYEVAAADAPLDQGDLIADCPVAGWKDGPVDLADGGDAIGSLRDAIELSRVDVVVMTQTCDLHQGNVHCVILCPHYSLDDYREVWESYRASRGRKRDRDAWANHLNSVVAGRVWHLAVLDTEKGEDYEADLRIVDFREVFSLPRDFLESWLGKEKRERLRLCPPYREHLSQAFARFFMRVGLPDIHRTW